MANNMTLELDNIKNWLRRDQATLLCEANNVILGAKDLNGYTIFLDHAYSQLLVDFNGKTLPLGIHDRKIPGNIAEYADEFARQDRVVVEKETKVFFEHKLQYCSGLFRQIGFKFPLRNDVGNVIAIGIHAYIVPNANVMLPNKLNNMLVPPRVMESLSLLQQGHTQKEIAVIMRVSRGTIDKYLAIAREQAGVATTAELKNSLLNKGGSCSFAHPNRMLNNNISWHYY